MNQMPGSLDQLNQKIIACRLCPRLVAWREEMARKRTRAYRDQEYWGKPVPGFGDPLARVFILGLAPGAHGSNRTGRMFTGDSSGDFLFAALHRSGFASQPSARQRDDGLFLTDTYISAVCRCAPPDNKPLPSEILHCQLFLEQDINLHPRIEGFVALGRIAADWLQRWYRRQGAESARLNFAHALFQQPAPNLPWVITSYHPSRQNTQTGKLTIQMFDQIWQMAREMIAKPG